MFFSDKIDGKHWELYKNNKKNKTITRLTYN